MLRIAQLFLVTPPLHFAFFGPSLVSTFWNGAATYHRGLLGALAQRGHRVQYFEPDVPDRVRHRNLSDPDRIELIAYPAKSRWSVLSAAELARGADVVVKCSGVGFYDEALDAGVLELRGPRGLAIYWDIDALATIDRLTHHSADGFRPLLRRYDLVLTDGGGESIVNAYEALGAARCVPLYNALDPQLHFPVAADPRFAADLAFLGHRLPDRENRVAEFFLRAAELLPTRNFLLGGANWEDCALPANVRWAGQINWADRPAFNATPTATLMPNRESLARRGFSPPTRLFEAAGAGACLIAEAWPGLELFLEPGTEVLVARDGAEVAAQVANLDPVRAAAIGVAARRRILAEHTFAHRAAQLEQLLTGRATAPVEPHFAVGP